MMQMRKFLFADAADKPVEFDITMPQEMELFIKVAVYGLFYSGRADPDRLPAQHRGK